MIRLAHTQARPPRARGIVVVQVAVVMSVLLGCAALAVDVGYMYNCRSEMQRVADASALAGASGLLDGSGVAYQRAIEYAGRNGVAGSPLSAEETTVSIGYWNNTTATFTPAGPSPLVSPNAVRVAGTRADISLFFANIFGIASTNVTRGASALYGGGRCTGIWGLEGINAVGDIITNSYNVEAGAYGPGNINANGDICSCQDITVSGGIEIWGDAMYGYGYSLTTHGGSYSIWGSVGPTSCGLDIPPIDMAAVAANNDNAMIGLTDDGRHPFHGGSSRLRLTADDNLTLYPGTYYFASVSIVGQATLTVIGPVKIYVDEDGTFTGGGIVNVSQDPRDLQIFSTGTQLDLKGGSVFYGGVVAPLADVKLVGTSDCYGVLLGRTLGFNGNTVIHVEESLVRDMLGMNTAAPVLVQ